MAVGYAIPLQKTHSIVFEPRRLCYPWHPWHGCTILTRPAGGARADVTYFCKLPEAPVDAMLVEIPRWMFDAAQCAGMRCEEVPHVDCATMRALKRTIAEQRASVTVRAAVIQPQLARQAGNGDTDGNDTQTKANRSAGAVQRTAHGSAVERSRGTHARRSGQTARAAPAQRSPPRPPSRSSKPRRVR